MKRDVMQSAGLESFAELAVIIFFITFAIVVVRTLLRRDSDLADVSQLPLQEGQEV